MTGYFAWIFSSLLSHTITIHLTITRLFRASIRRQRVAKVAESLMSNVTFKTKYISVWQQFIDSVCINKVSQDNIL